jgi:hypothetical protein
MAQSSQASAKVTRRAARENFLPSAMQRKINQVACALGPWLPCRHGSAQVSSWDGRRFAGVQRRFSRRPGSGQLSRKNAFGSAPRRLSGGQ